MHVICVCVYAFMCMWCAFAGGINWATRADIKAAILAAVGEDLANLTPHATMKGVDSSSLTDIQKATYIFNYLIMRGMHKRTSVSTW